MLPYANVMSCNNHSFCKYVFLAVVESVYIYMNNKMIPILYQNTFIWTEHFFNKVGSSTDDSIQSYNIGYTADGIHFSSFVYWPRLHRSRVEMIYQHARWKSIGNENYCNIQKLTLSVSASAPFYAGWCRFQTNSVWTQPSWTTPGATGKTRVR